jgi:hypothetical protein
MTGQDLKRQGQQLALENSGEWIDQIVPAFKLWAEFQKVSRRDFCLDDFREAVSLEPKSVNAWGALPRILVRKGLIEQTPVDFWPSIRPEAHGRRVAVWRLV